MTLFCKHAFCLNDLFKFTVNWSLFVMLDQSLKEKTGSLFNKASKEVVKQNKCFPWKI